ncbi:hypothetical protein [Synechococcus sp. 7002]|uniref:hypothetical protein n=1 Tax=Synechococcus sp. 7002 TaxID=1938862 RepID=UPI00351035EB
MGDQVRIKNVSPADHSRLPGHLKGTCSGSGAGVRRCVYLLLSHRRWHWHTDARV